MGSVPEGERRLYLAERAEGEYRKRVAKVPAPARRQATPWAAGLRGTAYLLRHQEAEAKNELAALHDSIAPLVGDYVADETVEFHGMQAAS
jgi:hypothetical protein